MELTQGHIDAAREAGACSEIVDSLEPGMRVEDLDQLSLIWVENNAPELASEYDGELPLWAAAENGSGYGAGHGYGVGHGYGDGSGYGHGYGDGSGYGDGDGSGSGHGYWRRP